MEKDIKLYYPIFKLWSFNLAAVVPSHPDDVEVKEIFKDKLIFIIIINS
jgi:hypothetical protein